MEDVLRSQSAWAFQAAIDHVAQLHTHEVVRLHEEIKTLRTDLDFSSSIVHKQNEELTALHKKQAHLTIDNGAPGCANMEDGYTKPQIGMSSALSPISPRLRRFCQDAIPMLNGIDKDPVSIADLWKWDSTADTSTKSEMIDLSDEHGFSMFIPGDEAERPAPEDYLQTPDETCVAGAQTPNPSITPRIQVTDLNVDLNSQPEDDRPGRGSHRIDEVHFQLEDDRSGQGSHRIDEVWVTDPPTQLNSKGSFRYLDSMDCDAFAVGRTTTFEDTDVEEAAPMVHYSQDKTPALQKSALTSRAVANWAMLVTMSMQAAVQELLQLLPVWVQPESFMIKVMRTNADIDICAVFHEKEKLGLRRGRFLRPTSVLKAEKADQMPEHQNKMGLHNCIMDPQSPKRIVWALLGMILMVYDLIMIPMQAFELEDHIVTDFAAWMSQIFWTLDIFVSFFTGTYLKNELEMRFQKIARVYATSWLPIDCLVTLPLWIVLFLGAEQDSAGQASQGIKSAKYVRLLRFLRLARLMKFDHLLSETLEFVNSSTVLLTVGMMKLIFCLALLNHINACLWFAIGNRPDGWVDKLRNENKGYQYLSAMHWALTQFQGTSDILPGQSTVERLYATATVLCALILLSAFVSRLTNMMMSLQGLHSKRTQQQRVVRGYLSNHNISASLSVRVKKYVAWKQQLERNSEYDVEIFNVLPPQLMMDLLDEVRHPRIIVHEFFKALHNNYPRVVRRICGDAISTLSPAPGEVIFHAYEACHRMYFAVGGTMNYGASPLKRKESHRPEAPGRTKFLEDKPDKERHSTRSNESLLSDSGSMNIEIHKGSFLSEGALWTDWKHCGELVVVTGDASLFLLGNEDFKQVVIQNQAAHASAVLYARRFVAVLNRFGFTHSDLIDPLHVIITGLDDESDSENSDNTDDNHGGKTSVRTSASMTSRKTGMPTGSSSLTGKFRIGNQVRKTYRAFSSGKSDHSAKATRFAKASK